MPTTSRRILNSSSDRFEPSKYCSDLDLEEGFTVGRPVRYLKYCDDEIYQILSWKYVNDGKAWIE